MKRSLIVILFHIIFSLSLFAQTRIDSNISINIPGEVKTQNFNETSVILKAFYANDKTNSYAVFRQSFLSEDKEINNLPPDLDSLKRIYNQTIASQIRSMNKKGFIFKDSVEIHLGKFVAYKLKYTDLNSSTQNAESIILCLNGINYVFTYGKVDSFVNKNKDDFLKSLKIDGSPEQIGNIQEISSFPIATMILYIIIIVVVIIILKRKSNSASKFGINLSTVYCPVCQTKQPQIRIPKNINQILYGGNTCTNCKTELDKYGNIIKEGNK
ncbi:MAG: hypothetical protein V4663_04195 [Bacteroidota bacterium]